MLDPPEASGAEGPASGAEGPAEMNPTDWIAVTAVVTSVMVTGMGTTLAFGLRVARELTAVRTSLDHLRDSVDSGFVRLDRELAEERTERRGEIADVRNNLRAQ